MELKIKELLQISEGKSLHTVHDSFLEFNISGISTDSRKVKKGELFIALKGKNFDGNDFVQDAFDKGAIGAIITKTKDRRPKTKDFLQLFKSHLIIEVADTLKALGDIAAYYRNKFKIPVIAITGSCGKTMTKEITAAMLSSKFKVLKSFRNYNNLIGVPITIFNLASEHEVVITELGMSCAGEIRRLAQIAKPEIAVITNVGKAHLGSFSDCGDVAKAKAELFQSGSLPKVSILNRDDGFYPYFLSKTGGKVITFGMLEDSDFYAGEVTFDSLGRASFLLNGEKKVKLSFSGRGNIYNALASFAVASFMGVQVDEAIESLSHIEIPSGRMNFYESSGISILDDTYNANPSSFINLLETVESMDINGKKILVMGDMLELGKSSEREHKEIGKLIAGSSVDVLIAVGENSRFTFEVVTVDKPAWHFGNNHNDAKKKTENLLNKGDLLIVKGSRGMHMEEFLPREVAIVS